MQTDAFEPTASWPIVADTRHGARRGAVSAAIVAHELAQPLAALTANLDAAVQYLSREPISLETVRDIVADATADVARANEILRHVLALVRRERIALTDIAVGSWLTRCAARHRREADRLGISIVVTSEPNLAIDGDVVQLDRALDNLVVNALQATASVRTAGRVALEARRCAHEVLVTVSDDGPGFHGAVLAGARTLVTTKAGGLGLGLAMVRKVAGAHGGRLELGNGAAGAVTMLRLPARPSPECQ